MAIPAVPANFILQQGNGQVLLTFSNVAGALNYPIYRSLDNVTFVQVAAPVINSYLDTSVVTGTQYYYSVAANNTFGTSAQTASQGIVPTQAGQMTLGQVRLASQQRADMVNNPFVTTAEWNSYITQSAFELYDLLVTTYENYYLGPQCIFITNGNQSSGGGFYPIPDGITSFLKPDGSSFVPPPLYKLTGLDCGLSNSSNAWVSLQKFNFVDRNKFIYPQLTSTILGVFNMAYRLMGNQLEIIPSPAANQYIRIWYVPRMTQPLADNDILDGISGWTEYVIVDAAIKAMQKEESDVSALMAQKMALKARIEEAGSNRDEGMADTISDTRRLTSRWGGQHGDGGFGGY